MEKSALDLAEKKAVREQREICVHRERRDDLPSDVFYITPKEKVGDNVSEYEHVETFEPDDTSDSDYERVPVRDSEELEEGDRVVVGGDSVHTVTKVSSRQIVTNFGDKFRKSDGVEWGGGEKQITHKLQYV